MMAVTMRPQPAESDADRIVPQPDPLATRLMAGPDVLARESASKEPVEILPGVERRAASGRQEVRVRRVTGFDRRRGAFPRRLSEQCRQALMNGATSLQAAGLSMSDVVRVTYLVHDADAFPACFPFLRDAFGEARPALTLRLVDGFDSPDIKIELELFARGYAVAA